MGQFESFIGVNFWTALFVLLNTLAIFFAAKKLLFKPVRKIIADRQAEIDGMYSDAERAKCEADELAADYRRKLGDAQKTSERMVREATERAQRQADEIEQDARDQAQIILTRAAIDADAERNKALNDAKDEISSIAVAIAEKVLERELTDRDQAVLVDHFIREMEENA